MISVSKAELALIKNILKQHIPECEVIAFGSRVTGKHHPYSDLDLAIKTQSVLSLDKIGAIKDAFSQSTLPFVVDLLDWQTIDPAFQQHILKQYETIQQKA